MRLKILLRDLRKKRERKLRGFFSSGRDARAPSFCVSPVLLFGCLAVAAFCFPDSDFARPVAHRGGPAEQHSGNQNGPTADQGQVVTLDVTVTQSGDDPVLGLTPEEFAVYEDGVRQTVLSLDGRDAPVSVGILLDASESQQRHLPAALEAVRAFVKDGHPRSEFFLMTFGKEVTTQVDFADGVALTNHLSAPRLRPKTVLYDAVIEGLRKVREGRHAKRALMLMTDGQDTGSRSSYGQMIRAVREAGVPIYCLGLGNTNSDLVEGIGNYQIGRLLLEEIAALTGGKAYLKDRPEQLTQETLAIARILHSQYRLTYRPTNQAGNGEWRKLKVQISPQTNRPKLRIEARQEYYFTP